MVKLDWRALSIATAATSPDQVWSFGPITTLSIHSSRHSQFQSDSVDCQTTTTWFNHPSHCLAGDPFLGDSSWLDNAISLELEWIDYENRSPSLLSQWWIVLFFFSNRRLLKKYKNGFGILLEFSEIFVAVGVRFSFLLLTRFHHQVSIISDQSRL